MTTTTTGGAAAGANEFDALLDDLDAFSKAMAKPGVKKIEGAAAAAEADGSDTLDDEQDDGNPDAASGPGSEVDGQMHKSLTVKLADGTEVEAFDGGAFIKALSAENAALKAGMAAHDDKLAKALRLTSGLFDVIKQQEVAIKSLGDDVRKLGASGTGRRAVLTVHEKPATTATPTGSPQPKLNHEDLIAKALELQAEGKCNANDVSIFGARLASGRPVQPGMAKLLGLPG